MSRVDIVAYRLALLLQFTRMHDVFHVPMLKKYMHDNSHVISYDDLDVKDDILIEDSPIKILERKKTILHNRAISLIKVFWTNHSEKKANWVNKV